MSASAQPTPESDGPSRGNAKRVAVSQQDVPRHTLEQALVIPETISREYAKQPTKPLDIAIALNQKPKSGHFRYLCGAAQAYGLTDGGPRVQKIGLTDLGRRIVAPTREGDDISAKREALMQPRVVREFLTRYDGSPLPSTRIALNVLEELGVPADATQRTLDFIIDSARSIGLLRDLKGDLYVDLAPVDVTAIHVGSTADAETERVGHETVADVVELPTRGPSPGDSGVDEKAPSDLAENRKVFITHGKKKRTIVEQVKELLKFGDFEPVMSAERETVAKPVPDKVMDDMRGCAAAVIHVGTETKVMDQEGEEHRMLNPNVLIEIGAAMALYGRKFILLVEEGTTLPSNLQGLYEVRYSGDELDHAATMKLLKAFNDFKS
jgi:hypothetical protein